jgi:hypothetical protein
MAKPFVYEPGRIYGNPVKAERARQMTVQLGTDKVNSVFDDPARQGQYDQFLQAIREFYTADANKQKAIADRNLKFSTARSGLTGGSAAVDSKNMETEEKPGMYTPEREGRYVEPVCTFIAPAARAEVVGLAGKASLDPPSSGGSEARECSVRGMHPVRNKRAPKVPGDPDADVASRRPRADAPNPAWVRSRTVRATRRSRGTVWYLRCTIVSEGSRRSRRGPVGGAADAPAGTLIFAEIFRWCPGAEAHADWF